MTLTNFPNGISSFGMPVMGSGAVFTTGDFYFVDSVNGSDDNDGKAKDRALATIDKAVGKCTANQGDYIIVMPNHAETITAAAGIDLDVAGITIVGIGFGENRPVITFGTATAADMDVDAADVAVKNIQFTVTIDALTALVDVNSTDFLMEDCEFRSDEGGTKAQMLIAVDVDGGTANACDRATFRRCKFTSETAGANSAIKLTEVQEGVIIESCTFFGDYSDAAIHNPTGKVLTNLQLVNNIVRNLQTGDHAVELVSACTGWAVGNRLIGDTLGTIFDPGSLFCVDNEETDAIDQASVHSPRTPASGNGPAANKDVYDAIGFDGTAVVAASAGMIRTMHGTTFIIKKSLTASAVVTGGVDVTGTSSVGDILIEDFILQTDATGLAAGTNFTLGSNNANGTAVFGSHTVASLGAGIVVDKKTANTGKSHVLESGKKVIAICTSSSCTGAGVIDVYLLCRRLADNATLAAA